MKDCKNCCKVMHILVLVGAVNWGLIGIGHFAGFSGNVVNMILGSMPLLENLVYILVGASAVMLASKCYKCKDGKCDTGGGDHGGHDHGGGDHHHEG